MRAQILFTLNDLEERLSDLMVLEVQALLRALEVEGVLTAGPSKEAEHLKASAASTGLLIARIQWMFKNAVVNRRFPKLQPDQEDAKIISEAEERAKELREAALRGVRVKVINGSQY